MDCVFVFALQIYKIFHTKAIAIPLNIKRIAILFLDCAAIVQEGNIRKTMAARGLVNGRSRAISESSGGCSQRTAKWEGFSFPLLSSRTSLHPPQKKQKLTFWVSLFGYVDTVRSLSGLSGGCRQMPSPRGSRSCRAREPIR